jgi:hypothetical protein
MSNTELTVYSRIADPLAFVREFGTEIALSKMFGCANEAQGKVFAMACLCEETNPIALSRKYNVIENNLSMKSDAMLAELRARGGKHRVLERTAEKASVEITYDDQVYVESFSWNEAQIEPYVFCKDGKTLKKNWATPRARRQMLWARVISEAVRTVAPEIVSGIYTPEETSDFVDESITVVAKPVDVVQLMQATAAKVDEKIGEVVDAEFEVVDDKPAKPKTCTAEQRTQIKSLFDAVGATEEQIKAAIAKRGVASMRYLTPEQANELIDGLTKKAQQAAEKVTGESKVPDDTRSSHTAAAVGGELVDQIKAMLKDDIPLMKRIKEHLVTNGKSKIADLSHEEALALKKDLEMETIENFFQRSLVPFEVDQPPSD